VLGNFLPKKENFLYVPASCLPYHISGYTTRTHEILKALANAIGDISRTNIETTNSYENVSSNTANHKFLDGKIFVLTRTGYPWDRKDSLVYPDAGKDYNILDGIRYDHLKTPKNSKLTALYAEEASLEFEKYIVKKHISCVHAASNHVNALPALIAAKRLGISFQYEMRGLWELTRISRQPEFAKSHNFKLGLDLEAFVAKHADRVFVISNQLSLYIQKNWGIPKEKIFLLPNCADVDKLKPDTSIEENSKEKSDLTIEDCDTESALLSKDLSSLSSDVNNEKNSENFINATSKIVIGYAGSLIVYEGLQTLLKAMDILVNRKNMNIHLNIIGDGEYRNTLEELARSLGLNNNVTFFGRLSPLEAKNKQDECSLICIPREPFEVCQIVPPIKLVEAMAKGKCVVVPDLPVFVDELSIVDNVTNNKALDSNSLSISNSNFESSSKVGSAKQLSLEELSNNDSGCIFFRSGNFENLAEVLANHLSNLDELVKRGIKAREYAIKNRQWKMFVPFIFPNFKNQLNTLNENSKCTRCFSLKEGKE
jgi:glycosyltransferase involved in cell wall biosynthesis